MKWQNLNYSTKFIDCDGKTQITEDKNFSIYISKREIKSVINLIIQVYGLNIKLLPIKLSIKRIEYRSPHQFTIFGCKQCGGVTLMTFYCLFFFCFPRLLLFLFCWSSLLRHQTHRHIRYNTLHSWLADRRLFRLCWCFAIFISSSLKRVLWTVR